MRAPTTTTTMMARWSAWVLLSGIVAVTGACDLVVDRPYYVDPVVDEPDPPPEALEPDAWPEPFIPLPGEGTLLHPLPEDTVDDGPCVDACAGISPNSAPDVRAVARCYSCQCKSAMDGWLPNAAELQCVNGEEVVMLSRDDDGELVPDDGAACATPSSFQHSCDPGSRHGRLAQGDVEVRWLCRSTLGSTGSTYDLVGVIAHNERSGATCFWDAHMGTVGNVGLPPLDIVDAPDDEVDAHLRRIGTLGGEGCIGCHEADPFVYTPFLTSVDAPSGNWMTGPYHLVGLSNGPVTAVEARHITAPEVRACTQCHRLGATLSSDFALHASGRQPPGGQQPLDFPFDRWMPHAEMEGMTETEWEAVYGSAVDHLLACGYECLSERVPMTVDDLALD